MDSEYTEGNTGSMSIDASMESDDGRQRVYQTWQGRNHFACGGRLMFGADIKTCSVTWVVFVLPTILYGALVPSIAEIVPVGAACIPFAWVAAFIVSLLTVNSMDPGIIPRKPKPMENNNTFGSGPPLTKVVETDGKAMTYVYCITCNVYRPPRASHCRACDNCVERFDHHCPMMGTCIGKRNIRFFVVMLMCANGFAISVVAVGMTYLIQSPEEWQWGSPSILCCILLAYAGCFLWFLLPFCGFHLFLICTDRTTRELLSTGAQRCQGPVNCMRFFYGKIEPSKINRRELVSNMQISEELVASDIEKNHI